MNVIKRWCLMGIGVKLRTNKELIELREEWKSKTDEPFPAFNFDEFISVESYIQHIKIELSTL